MEASRGEYAQPGSFFLSIILCKERQKEREGGVWVSWRKPEEKDQRPRKHDLGGMIEWTGVS